MKSREYWKESLNNCLQKHGLSDFLITDEFVRDVMNIASMEDEYSGILDTMDAHFNKHKQTYVKMFNEKGVCSKCGNIHFLHDMDAGSEREMQNLCEKCINTL